MIKVSKWKRANGYWYVRYWLNGQPMDESAKTRTESKAESHRLRREIELNAGIEPLRHEEVNKLSKQYLASMPPKTTPSHSRVAERVLKTFIRLCGRKLRNGSYRLQSQQINPEMIDRFVRLRTDSNVFKGEERDSRGRRVVRRRRISNVTLKTELRYLSGFCNWCCRQRPRYLRENPIPLSNAANVKNDAKPHFMITDTELRALLRACETPRQYLFLLLGWWTGGRRSEIRALHYYHFDFAAGTLDVRHMKNNSLSVLPISVEILTIVKDLYKHAGESDPIFSHDPFLHHGFESLCREAGIRHHRFHDFRISTSMKIKSGGFDASLAGLWVGNQAATNRAHYTDLTAVATQIGSLLELSDLPPVPSQTA